MINIQKNQNTASLTLTYAVEQLPGYIDHLNINIEATATYYKNGQINIARDSLGKLIDSLDIFVQFIHLAQTAIRPNLDKPLNKKQSVRELSIRLLSIIKAIQNSRKNEDYVMLIDLLEYELKDTLTQWKISVVPYLNRLIIN